MVLNAKQIPIKVWLIIFVSFLTPILFEFLAANTAFMEEFASIVWLLHLIPSTFFSYYYGLRGGLFSAFLFIILHLLVELIDNPEDEISVGSLLILGEISFANLLLIVPISRLFVKLNKEKLQLESVTTEMTKRKEQLQNIFDNLDVAIWSLDVQEQSLQVSTELERIYGVSREEIVMNPDSIWSKMIHPEDRFLAENLDQQLFSGQPGNAVYRILRRDGEVKWVQDRGVPIVDASGKVIRIDGVVIDITEMKLANDQIKKMAFYDPLTGLPNRRFFEKKLSDTLAQAKSREEQLVILFMDLDGFKNVNDTLGHEAGDRLLQEVGARSKKCMGPADLIARLAGDEFTILLPNASVERAIDVSQRLIDEIQKPFLFADNQARVTPSIGISLFPEHGESPENLVKRADEAMYRAKAMGKNNVQVYKNVGVTE
ncbi:diguanylate cyclase domain-containing protein [Ammoniphilus resinae]|uniref:Diguanylate cyclase (GGDEF)-like protein/PAS domain S-box-containing protein n=1 Tax=Ammoniphilus resinae TaxID=861532 RepID=A0ABS4GWN6_9BACL|nr:diguanylate cyclase [Ammoniphilus resinae]MBP1934679.1 diguanylate cyclase (GGDEF)-like protein/PAS domain S-box-containing protein [Ammoniphilus resinae]